MRPWIPASTGQRSGERLLDLQSTCERSLCRQGMTTKKKIKATRRGCYGQHKIESDHWASGTVHQGHDHGHSAIRGGTRSTGTMGLRSGGRYPGSIASIAGAGHMTSSPLCMFLIRTLHADRRLTKISSKLQSSLPQTGHITWLDV